MESKKLPRFQALLQLRISQARQLDISNPLPSSEPVNPCPSWERPSVSKNFQPPQVIDPVELDKETRDRAFYARGFETFFAAFCTPDRFLGSAKKDWLREEFIRVNRMSSNSNLSRRYIYSVLIIRFREYLKSNGCPIDGKPISQDLARSAEHIEGVMQTQVDGTSLPESPSSDGTITDPSVEWSDESCIA